MNILLITPPLTQLNTPYPATTVLKGFLQNYGHSVHQADLGIELINEIYTKKFLTKAFAFTANKKKTKSQNQIFNNRESYINTVESVLEFLQDKEQSLATRIANRTLLPEGPRFENITDMEWAFGVSGTNDKARHLATLYIEDIADYLRDMIDNDFELVRYAESIASYAGEFSEIETKMNANPNIIDDEMHAILDNYLRNKEIDIVGFSIPFPGCLCASLKCADYIRRNYPNIKIVLGGGYPNTELRSLKDSEIFKYIDYIILDDGELPLLRLISYLEGKESSKNLVRTYYLKNNQIIFSGNESQNIPFSEIGIPDFEGLPLYKYFSLAEMTNPMHKLWTNGRWNKMIMAHGCYWSKCAFCDTSLDYISRYEAPSASLVVDRMEAIMQKTGETGFHFTDEAMPPKLLKEISFEIIKRKLVVSFWGNIRFEKSYNQELCEILSEAGCIAVSGGSISSFKPFCANAWKR